MPSAPPPAPSTPVFDLDGGRLCLDFANTLGGRSGEHLHTYADLVTFAAQSHLITQAEANQLHRLAAAAPAAAEAVLDRARGLRSALRAIFFAVAQARPIASADLDALNAALPEALSHARLVVEAQPRPRRDGAVGGNGEGAETGLRWGWRGLALEAPLWPIVRSAADVLTSDDERRLVRECGADDCQWLFMDNTRNRSRQWCSTQSCGNREKARRHYQRRRASGASASTGPRAS